MNFMPVLINLATKYFFTNKEVKPRSDNKCCICINDMNNPLITPCNHSFCRGCIKEWLTNKDTCPLCVQEIVPISLRNRHRLKGKESNLLSKLSPILDKVAYLFDLGYILGEQNMEAILDNLSFKHVIITNPIMLRLYYSCYEWISPFQTIPEKYQKIVKSDLRNVAWLSYCIIPFLFSCYLLTTNAPVYIHLWYMLDVIIKTGIFLLPYKFNDILNFSSLNKLYSGSIMLCFFTLCWVSFKCHIILSSLFIKNPDIQWYITYNVIRYILISSIILFNKLSNMYYFTREQMMKYQIIGSSVYQDVLVQVPGLEQTISTVINSNDTLSSHFTNLSEYMIHTSGSIRSRVEDIQVSIERMTTLPSEPIANHPLETVIISSIENSIPSPVETSIPSSTETYHLETLPLEETSECIDLVTDITKENFMLVIKNLQSGTELYDTLKDMYDVILSVDNKIGTKEEFVTKFMAAYIEVLSLKESIELLKDAFSEDICDDNVSGDEFSRDIFMKLLMEQYKSKFIPVSLDSQLTAGSLESDDGDGGEDDISISPSQDSPSTKIHNSVMNLLKSSIIEQEISEDARNSDVGEDEISISPSPDSPSTKIHNSAMNLLKSSIIEQEISEDARNSDDSEGSTVFVTNPGNL